MQVVNCQIRKGPKKVTHVAPDPKQPCAAIFGWKPFDLLCCGRARWKILIQRYASVKWVNAPLGVRQNAHLVFPFVFLPAGRLVEDLVAKNLLPPKHEFTKPHEIKVTKGTMSYIRLLNLLSFSINLPKLMEHESNWPHSRCKVYPVFGWNIASAERKKHSVDIRWTGSFDGIQAFVYWCYLSPRGIHL